MRSCLSVNVLQLVRGELDADDEGELILLANCSATSGYMQLPSDPRKHRSLSGGTSALPTERYATGDRFRRVMGRNADGQEWLLYVCRVDDLLVHTSGEMALRSQPSRHAPPHPRLTLH